MAAPLRLGLLIPCRDERAVIERKLRNLALAHWPAAVAPHRIIVIDDGSVDSTAEVASRCAADLFAGHPSAPTVEVLDNDQRPGKAGAIASGLTALGDTVDLIVLSDADVILRPEALGALTDLFTRSPELGMACGGQELVADLASDGSPTGRDGGPLRPRPGRYDRWTAAIRALESRRGVLFSVHGQLLAWRAELGLVPTPGIAADDLDLMRQTRARGRQVVKVPEARFIEIKTPPGEQLQAQEQRRARAYFEVIGSCHLPAGSPWWAQLHWACYRWLPGAAPRMVLLALVLGPPLCWWAFGTGAALLALALAALAVISAPGRRALRLLAVIEAARRAQRRATLGDRWQTPR